MAEVNLCIYKTPAQADRIGRSFSKTETISRTDAQQIRDWYKDIEDGRHTTMDAIALVSGLLAPILKSICLVTFSISALSGTSGFLETYFSQISSTFGKLLMIWVKTKKSHLLTSISSMDRMVRTGLRA